MRIDQVYQLAGDIHDVGWNDSIPDPLAFMSKEGDERPLAFNEEMVRSSGGRLPPVDRTFMRYFAGSCNHTVWALKCFAAKMPSDNPRISLNGRLDVALFKDTDPTFAKRVEEGMVWKVLSWQVKEYYPATVDLLIKAKNAPGQINMRTSVFEVLLEIHNLARSTAKETGCPDWALVQQLIGRAKPPCLHMLQYLIEFVVSCSGGKSGEFLTELVALWRNCGLGGLTREVSSKLWAAIAASGCPENNPMCRLKNMIALTTLTAEQSTIVDTTCTFVAAGDLSIFSSTNEEDQTRLRECSAILDVGFRVLDKFAEIGVDSAGVRVNESAPSKLKLKFATQVVRFLLSGKKNKQKPSEQFKSVNAIGADLLQALRRTSSDEAVQRVTAGFPDIVKNWTPEEKRPDDPTSGRTAGPRVTLREAGAGGMGVDVRSMLLRESFDLGQHVKNKKCDDLWIVAEVEEGTGGEQGKVVLKALPDKLLTVKVSVASFSKEYLKPPAGYENKLLHADAQWKMLDIRTSEAAALALARADVLKALEVAARLHNDGDQLARPMLNLKGALAGVQAASGANPGKIVLAPWTTSIAIELPSKKEDWRPTPADWIVHFEGDSPLDAFGKEFKESSVKTHPCISLQPSGCADKEEKSEKKGAENPPRTKMAVFWRVAGVSPKEKQNVEKVNTQVGEITVDTLGSIVKTTKNIGTKYSKKPDYAVSARLTHVHGTQTIVLYGTYTVQCSSCFSL